MMDLISLVMLVAALPLAVASFVGANRAINADDESTLVRWMCVMAGLGFVSVGHIVRF